MNAQTFRIVKGVAALAIGAAMIAPASAAIVLSAPSARLHSPIQRMPNWLSLDALTFQFTTLDDNADPTFNQLLGIDNKGEICGYFGSGAPGHPNKGYTLKPPYGQIDDSNENFSRFGPNSGHGHQQQALHRRLLDRRQRRQPRVR